MVGESTESAEYRGISPSISHARRLVRTARKDASIPQDTVETMRQALRQRNATAGNRGDPEADHAFNADDRAQPS